MTDSSSYRERISRSFGDFAECVSVPGGRKPLVGSLLGVLLLALATARCTPAPEGWKPVLEETSTTSLRTEAQMAAEHVGRAKDLMAVAPGDAKKELEGAEEALRRLLLYYFPLVDARELSYNAYRHLYLGEKDRAAGELIEAEKILVEMAGGGEHLARALESPLAALAAARAALAGSSGDAPARLTELANELDGLVVKGRLVLHQGEW